MQEAIDSGEIVFATLMPGETKVPDFTTAAIFFETRGGIQQLSRGYLIQQNVIALWGVIDAIADGSLSEADPDRWDDIPARGGTIRNPSFEGLDYEEEVYEELI